MTAPGLAVVRLYTGDDGQSHFEDLMLPMSVIAGVGAMSGRIPAESVFFRDTADTGPEVMDFHVAPRRQFVIHLAGRAEIEVGDGSKRQFGVGDLLIADDTTGQGHISREIEGPRRQIFVPLDDRADLTSWQV